MVNTVSPTYAEEILRPEFGFGLHRVLASASDKLLGIINGLDYSVWNPETDKYIYKPYSVHSLADKDINKDLLRKECNLPLKKVMLIGLVGRLAQQKGFDLLAEAMPDLCNLPLQIVILGTGDLKYHVILQSVAQRFPGTVSVHLKFDNPLAHKIYAACDVFLMPSRYEPCGLGQMISLRYGTIPLVHKTGGLADTVDNQNGFVFDKYSKDALFEVIKKAAEAYEDKAGWHEKVRRAFTYNFSWEESAKKYIQLYQKLIAEKCLRPQ
jgi:starch synthase